MIFAFHFIRKFTERQFHKQYISDALQETSESEGSVNESEQGNESIEQDDNDDTVDDTRKSEKESVPRKKKVGKQMITVS